MKQANKKDRTPEIVERYRSSATFHRAANTLYELLTAGLSEHDLRDCVRMAVELQGWSMLDRMREKYGEESIPEDAEYRNGLVLPIVDVPESVTACRADLPRLLKMRSDPATRNEVKRSIATLREYQKNSPLDLVDVNGQTP